MGRKKLPENYFDKTVSRNIRIDRKIGEDFVELYQERKARYADEGKKYYVKNVFERLLQIYIDEQRALLEKEGATSE